MTPQQGVTVERDRSYCPASRCWSTDWYAKRGRKYLGVVLRQPNGELSAFAFDSPRHYASRVPTVAAGVRWIEMRAPC
jgi:hypothetical protein